MINSNLSIAVLIPCFNEEAAIYDVVQSLKRKIPEARVYVYDNNSTDDTVKCALLAGAIVCFEPRQGKGNVVSRMFADIEADVYLMIDGDGTYDIDSAPEMIEALIAGKLDMVVGTRLEQTDTAHRSGHKFGNLLFNKVLSIFFKSEFKDIFSGYRVFSRRFVKSFPALSSGFDIETELSIHSLEMNLPVKEIETPFFERAEGSVSKLSTFKDGFLILWRMIFLFKEVKPLVFFGTFFVFFVGLSLLLGYPLVTEFLHTGLVPRFPTAILSVGIMLLGFLSLTCGFILDSLSYGRREAKRLRYLSLPAPGQYH
ncbi:MAG: glycosyltransferase [Alphaproteobacteria bacterium]|nr:glycosyltransferase [Alphaproteobacteria bacterium]